MANVIADLAHKPPGWHAWLRSLRTGERTIRLAFGEFMYLLDDRTSRVRHISGPSGPGYLIECHEHSAWHDRKLGWIPVSDEFGLVRPNHADVENCRSWREIMEREFPAIREFPHGEPGDHGREPTTASGGYRWL